MDSEVKKAQIMELDSLTDLLRLVVSIMGRSNVSGHLYYVEKDGLHVYFLTHSINGWYNQKGLPVTLMATEEEGPEENFIEYKYATEGSEEGFSFTDQIKKSTQSIFIPIIKVKTLPEFML